MGNCKFQIPTVLELSHRLIKTFLDKNQFNFNDLNSKLGRQCLKYITVQKIQKNENMSMSNE